MSSTVYLGMRMGRRRLATGDRTVDGAGGPKRRTDIVPLFFGRYSTTTRRVIGWAEERCKNALDTRLRKRGRGARRHPIVRHGRGPSSTEPNPGRRRLLGFAFPLGPFSGFCISFLSFFYGRDEKGVSGTVCAISSGRCRLSVVFQETQAERSRPTRLVTRTKESNAHASDGVANPTRREAKAKGDPPLGEGVPEVGQAGRRGGSLSLHQSRTIGRSRLRWAF